LISFGYRAEVLLEDDDSGRLATVRMISAGEREIFVDLLFDSAGVESEVVESSSKVEIFPGLALQVASRSSLIALKVLSANPKTRIKDIIDLQNLLSAASPTEVEDARALLDRITQRGYNRNKDLQTDLDRYIEQFKS